MLTKLTIRNFKRFDRVVIDLDNPVVFIGPNNSGKTSALQALALWEIGLKRWREKIRNKSDRRYGVAINRMDIIPMPVPQSNLFWRNTTVQSAKNPVRIEIIVEGITGEKKWEMGLEFSYRGTELMYCKPVKSSIAKDSAQIDMLDRVGNINMAFLPPMSGLAAIETRLDSGAVNVRIGQGRTAEVLRNLCYKLFSEDEANWKKIKDRIRSLFLCDLEDPQFVIERGEINMSYRENKISLDISASGKGLQQTLLLLAYMYSNPNAVLLIDEPDAHLEMLRQREIYRILSEVSKETHSQVIIASHSEVILSEAAANDTVIAFIGKPHPMSGKSQIRKALENIGFEQYYQAEQTGWVLYLEGATDLRILQTFAKILEYEEAVAGLERPFVKYVGNHPEDVKAHFWGVKEAKPELVGIAIFDKLDKSLPEDLGAKGFTWNRREIENYLCYPETLANYARASAENQVLGPLFAPAEVERRIKIMDESVVEIKQALEKLGKGSPWAPDLKVSDEFLSPVFELFFKKLNLPNVMLKKSFHELAAFVPKEKLDPEIKEKLDAIVEVSKKANPAV